MKLLLLGIVLGVALRSLLSYEGRMASGVRAYYRAEVGA